MCKIADGVRRPSVIWEIPNHILLPVDNGVCQTKCRSQRMNAMKWMVVCAVAMLGLVAPAWAQPTSVQTGPYTVHETHLGQMDAERLSPIASRDRRHLAYVTHRSQKQCVVVDGKADTEYDLIQEGSLIFSPDGHRVAYAARNGQTWFAVVDGHPNPYDLIVLRTLIFSPDSNAWHMVFRRAKNGSWWWTARRGAEYDGFAAGSLVFSPDSKHVAYQAWNSQKFCWYVVVDNQASSDYDGVDALLFSPTLSAWHTW